MATGIVSIALLFDGNRGISRVLLGIALAVWLLLAGLFLWRAASDRGRFGAEARSAAGLTGVAGTAVLGARFLELGWSGPAAAMLVLAGGLWLVLIPLVLSTLPRRASGGLFMLTVSAQSLAVLAASLAEHDRAPFMEYLALPLAAAGVVLYLLVLARFDFRELLRGSGDQWIGGGALAITTLAGAQITHAAARLAVLGGSGTISDDVTLALWAAAVAWLPALLIGELHKPRPHYDAHRWATVFPFGMYAVCSYATSGVVGIAPLHTFAQTWTWIALAAWAATLLGLLMRGARIDWSAEDRGRRSGAVM